MGLNVLLGGFAFILASAIPVFNYILALAGSVCFAPMSLIFPALMWFHDFGAQTRSAGARGKALWFFHATIAAVGVFLTVGGM